MGSPPTEQKILHRLIYRVLPTSTHTEHDQQPSTKLIKYEISLAQPKPPLSQNTMRETALEEDFEYPRAETESSEDGSPRSLVLPSQCWSGTENTVTLMIPDRPMDVHFSVFDATLLSPGQEPMELQNYLTDLRSFLEYKVTDTAQPEPPLTLTLGNLTYVLHTSASVRQSNESVSVDPTNRHPAPATSPPSSIGVVTESILDLESNYRSTVCQINWDARRLDEGWTDFLSDCDHLSSAAFRPVDDTNITDIE